MNSPIEPCPYCGSKVASVGYARDRSYYFVSCLSGCGVTGPKGRNEELAICAWNDLSERCRSGESINTKLLARIADALDKIAETGDYESPAPLPPSEVKTPDPDPRFVF